MMDSLLQLDMQNSHPKQQSRRTGLAFNLPTAFTLRYVLMYTRIKFNKCIGHRTHAGAVRAECRFVGIIKGHTLPYFRAMWHSIFLKLEKLWGKMWPINV